MIINHREIPILKPCVALIIGILLSLLIPTEIRVSSIFLYVILLFFAWQILTKKKTRQGTRNTIILLLIVGFGICSVQERDPSLKSFSYDVDAKNFTLRIEKILAHSKHKKCIANILSTQKNDSTFIKSNGKILVYFQNASLDSSISVGREYLVSGKLSSLQKNSNPHAFDYASYLRHQGIYHQIFLKEKAFKYLRINEKSILHSLIFRIQSWADHIIQINFPTETNQALVDAMVLGNRDDLSQEQKQLFIDTGAIHVLAVSGLHVGILCLFLSFLLKIITSIIPLHKIIQGLIIISCIWVFALVTGASSAVCRAALMFSLFYIAKDILRRYVSVYNVIFSSAFILLLIDPHQIFKVSFQFSYLAVISIVFFFPYVNKWVNSKYKFVNYIWSSIALGISAQVLVFPISIFYFNKFASSFLITSIFVVQLAMVILIASIIILMLEALRLTMISQKIIAPITNWVLDVFQLLIAKVQALPFSYIDNIWIDKNQLILSYLILSVFMLFMKLKKLRLIVFGITLCLITIMYTKLSTHLHSIQHKAIVYNDRQGSIDVFVGKDCFHLGVESEAGKSFVYGRNRLAHQIHTVTQLNEPISKNALEYKHGMLRLGNLFIAFANVESFTEVQTSPKYNYLIVNTENSDLSKIDLGLIKNTEVILDGSLAPWVRKDMIAYCEHAGLSYYDVKTQGAKTLFF